MPIPGTKRNTEESHEPTSVLPSQRGLKLASLNINKLITHIDELRILLAHNEIDILSINETKLNETIADNEVNILGYDIIRRDRITNGGRGVCFYVKNSINFTIRNDLNIDTLENLCLEIQKPRSKPFVVATWYRPPDSPIGIFSLFETLIGKLDSENIEYYLMEDLNCDMIATRYNNNTCKLMSITDIYGLQQLITEPTRITPTSATLIDVIYTKKKIISCGVPQKTILGPLLFLLYINDLPNCLSSCEPRMYADDTHLTYAGDDADNIQLRLNQDLENVHNWLRANKLTLNMTKTEFMLIGSRQRLNTLTESPTFAINDFQISQVPTAKSLGVIIDDRLDWSGHIRRENN